LARTQKKEKRADDVPQLQFQFESVTVEVSVYEKRERRNVGALGRGKTHNLTLEGNLVEAGGKVAKRGDGRWGTDLRKGMSRRGRPPLHNQKEEFLNKEHHPLQINCFGIVVFVGLGWGFGYFGGPSLSLLKSFKPFKNVFAEKKGKEKT